MDSNKVYQGTDVLARLKAFAVDPVGYLLLAGKNGTGKSFAAKSILNSNARRYPDRDDRKMISQAEFNISWIKQNEEWRSTSYMMDMYKRIPLLCLDDIGTRKPTEAFMDFLYALVDHRWNNRDTLGTIITTNLNSASMREIMGDPFTSRACSGDVIRFEGKDRRLKEW